MQVHGCRTRRLANAGASTAPVCRYLHTHVYEDDPFFEQFNGGTVFSAAPRCGVGAVDTSI
jgi:hypothetical protein